MSGRYLPAEAIALLAQCFKAWPIGSLGAALFGVGLIYAALQRRFKRTGADLLIVAAGLAALTAFAGACLWVLSHSSGYRIL